MSMAEEFTYLETGEKKKVYTVCEEFIRVMHLVIDGEASQKEKEWFSNHISSSEDCLKHFDDEKTFRNFFKEKCQCLSMPKEVIEEIKAKLASMKTA